MTNSISLLISLSRISNYFHAIVHKLYAHFTLDSLKNKNYFQIRKHHADGQISLT